MGAKKRTQQKGKTELAEMPEAEQSAATEAPAAKKSRRSGRRRTPPDSAAKANFVAKFPPTTATTEIVAEARKAGLTMSEKFVRKLRAKGRGATPGKRIRAATQDRGHKTRTARAPAPAARKNGASHEAQFRAAIVELGYENAQALLSRVRDQLLRGPTA